MIVLHVIHEYDYAEGMGRTIDTISSRNGLINYLLCGRIKRRSSAFLQIKVRRFLNPFFVRREAVGVKADVVHFHGGLFSALLGSITPVGGAKKVATVYGWPSLQLKVDGLSLKQLWGTPALNKRVLLGRLISSKLAAWMLRKMVITTPDGGVRDSLSDRGVRVLQYETATPPTGVLVEREKERGFVLSMAGRAELTRGADVFMGVVASMNARGIPTKGVIALLPGPHSSVIKNLSNGRRDIDVLTEPIDLRELFAGSDLVVMPFRADYTTSPPVLVAEEALACGIPVVTSDVLCMRTAVDESCAVILSNCSVKEYADAVEYLLTNHEAREALRKGAAERPSAAWERSNAVSAAIFSYGPSL